MFLTFPIFSVGSACVTCALASVLERPALFFGTDCNYRATLASKANTFANKVRFLDIVIFVPQLYTFMTF